VAPVAAGQVATDGWTAGTGDAALNHSPAELSIELEGVGFGYREGQPVVSQVSLSVSRGTKAAIVGRTGAGKTTIMNLIAGLYAPWSGQARVAGLDPHRLDPGDRRRLIGVVPQSPAVFEGSIHDNITLGDESISAADVEEACRLVGLHEHVERLAAGYGTALGAGGIRLSHGQNQLLSIARAVACRPPVLLLDEPTSGMDTETEARVFAALRAASRDRTIVTISHRVSGIIDADVVFVLANGRVVQSGTPAELGGRQGWYAVFRQLEELGWRVS
jgi:ATP-binding cassette subfamily B protein